MAFNLLPNENSTKIGIAAKPKRAGWKTDYLPKVLSQKDAFALALRQAGVDDKRARR